MKSTLCINGEDIIEISKYLSFGNDTNPNNTKVIFADCMDTFSYDTAPNISSATLNLNSSDKFIQNSIAGGAVLESFQCNHTSSTCAIVCDNAVSCFYSSFLISSTQSTIHCGSAFACGYGTINASKEINDLESLHIICDQQSSCISTQINIDSVDEFILDCIEHSACASDNLHHKHHS